MVIAVFPSWIGISSIEDDAKKYAEKYVELQHRSQQSIQNSASGDVVSESIKLVAESAALQQEIENKYPANSNKREKLGKALSKALIKAMSDSK